jgi:predicted transcriptional regulator
MRQDKRAEQRNDSISVRIPTEAKDKLKVIAVSKRRTLSQLVAIIIDDYLKQRETQAASKRGGGAAESDDLL